MTANVVAVSEETPVHEVVGLLLKYRVSAVPVVDQAQNVLGIVSEGDLLRPEGQGGVEPRRPWWLEAMFGGETGTARTRGRTAGSVMTRGVVSVDENAPLNEIAALLERHHIKRVPVLRDGRLAGIVSRANLLHGLAGTIVERHEPGAAQDRALRDALVKTLLATPKLETVLVNVTVENGHVRLWGVVDNAGQARVAEAAARALPGVTSVENNLGPGPVSGVPI